MPKYKFKIGDIVKCVDDGGKAVIKNGRTYTISGFYHEENEKYVALEGVGSDGVPIHLLEDRFELAVLPVPMDDTRPYLETITES